MMLKDIKGIVAEARRHVFPYGVADISLLVVTIIFITYHQYDNQT